MAPGILYVTMRPKASLPPAQFHEWYDNEHGPTRLRIPSIFTNGFRYRSTDTSDQPPFMAVYDVTDLDLLATHTYTSLRENRSPREASTIADVDVIRAFYTLIHTHSSPSFTSLEALDHVVTVAVTVHVTDADAYRAWFEEEHAPMLAKVPGWLRSRLFVPQEGGDAFFALHDYSPDNGLDGPEHKASMDTPRRNALFKDAVVSKDRATWELFYTFGPAPRDLKSLSEADASTFTSVDGLTTTDPEHGVISSYVTVPTDGHRLPYRLEGNPNDDAPAIVFCNSLLTSFHMWDELISLIKQHRPEFRLLRYDTRGRHADTEAATLNRVTDDLASVLDALRIHKAHVVGVSMGGATTLNFGIRHPERVLSFIACDFNAVSSAKNTQAWKDRIEVARGDGIQKLAEETVLRWFHPHSLEKASLALAMTQMVAANDVDGFANSCTALWDYDMTEVMTICHVPGTFVVGEGDGKGALVKAMQGFKDNLGKQGAELRVVKETGHLPMYEDAPAFWDAIKDRL